MVYNPDKTWDDLSRSAARYTRVLLNALDEGAAGYREWTDFLDGRGASTVATGLGRSATEVNEMIDAYDALDLINNYAQGNSTSTSTTNFKKQLRKFS